jgi:hypothetical protein
MRVYKIKEKISPIFKASFLLFNQFFLSCYWPGIWNGQYCECSYGTSWNGNSCGMYSILDIFYLNFSSF